RRRASVVLYGFIIGCRLDMSSRLMDISIFARFASPRPSRAARRSRIVNRPSPAAFRLGTGQVNERYPVRFLPTVAADASRAASLAVFGQRERQGRECIVAQAVETRHHFSDKLGP